MSISVLQQNPINVSGLKCLLPTMLDIPDFCDVIQLPVASFHSHLKWVNIPLSVPFPPVTNVMVSEQIDPVE